MIALEGLIRRRLLLNYSVAPEVIRRILPSPFEPLLVEGHAIAGICLIRLERIHPRGLPVPCGLSSENAAHRVAVRWPVPGGERTGVWIPRRDTDSRLNQFAGGRLFPSLHHHARFEIEETEQRIRLAMRSDDGSTSVKVEASRSEMLPRTSVFKTMEKASSFFRDGSAGFSPANEGRIAGVRLVTDRWAMEPLNVERVESSFFGDSAIFPAGAATFDCGLLMSNLPHEWREEIDLPVPLS